MSELPQSKFYSAKFLSKINLFMDQKYGNQLRKM